MTNVQIKKILEWLEQTEPRTIKTVPVSSPEDVREIRRRMSNASRTIGRAISVRSSLEDGYVTVHAGNWWKR